MRCEIHEDLDTASGLEEERRPREPGAAGVPGGAPGMLLPQGLTPSSSL